MGAVDVAFTEAAVGAGVSTVFFIAVIFNTTRRIILTLGYINQSFCRYFMCTVFGYLLFLGVSDLPEWGDPESPVNANVASYYVSEAYKRHKST